MANGNAKVIGVDIDQSWGPKYKNNPAIKDPRFSTSHKEIDAKEIDVVVFSHLLYTESSVNDAIALLKKCKKGTIVIVRGASPNSFFTLTSMVFSLRLLTPTRSHYWYKSQLRKLVKSAGLVRVLREEDQIKPDGVVIQKYELNSDSAMHAQNLLGFLYGRIAGDSAKRYLDELMRPGDAACIPNDDLVYVYSLDNQVARER